MNKKSGTCLICGNEIHEFISYGKMPLANGFLTREQFEDEYFFELRVAHCSKCNMVQLMEQPEREKMFNDHYAFYSGTSKVMAEHFESFANHLIRDFIVSDNPFVVEIGSNDGILLKHFKNRNIRHLGIEPSENVAAVAKANGINTISEFFNKNLAEKIISEYGRADAFIGANVMCHIPYIHSVAEGIKTLLKPEGILMFEDPYLGDVINKVSYDQIYDEHVFLFTVHSVNYLFEQHDMEVVDVEPQETHGGSMRYVVARRGAKKISENVGIQIEKEFKQGLHLPETYIKFRENCEASRNELKSILLDLKNQGKRVVGYAATSKSTTILNYCDIGSDLIEFICDTTPIKQGKFSPGKHIPVKPYEEFKNNYPDYALLFAYNHEKEIMAKETVFRESGHKWIVYVPEIGII
jgi:methylation protein EvaC